MLRKTAEPAIHAAGFGMKIERLRPSDTYRFFDSPKASRWGRFFAALLHTKNASSRKALEGSVLDVFEKNGLVPLMPSFPKQIAIAFSKNSIFPSLFRLYR